tara:strand:+ start:9244 stop:9561 length:318 start_codon:yes stop_codon:yes gene_type:complete
MYSNVTSNDFVDAFKNNSQTKDNFTDEGLRALFGYLEMLEIDCDAKIELDPIGLCCDWSEYDSLDDFNEQQGSEFTDITYLEEHSTVIFVNDNIYFTGRFIVANY